MARTTRLVRLPDGTPVWARIDTGPAPGGSERGAPAWELGRDPGPDPEPGAGVFADSRARDSRDDHDDPGSYGDHGSHGDRDSYDDPGSYRDRDPYDDYDDVGALGGALARVSRLREVVTGVAASVRDAAERAAPDEVAVEFGVEFAVRGGAIVSVLADAETTGTLKVTLTWKDRLGRATPPSQDRRPAPAVPPPSGGGGDA